MKKIIAMILATLLVAGCSTEDDPVVPPDPDFFTATCDFFNFLVGDGSIDTRASFRQGPDIRLADYILPNGGALDRDVLLASPLQATALNFFLTEGDSTILNQGEVFVLYRDNPFVFVALGDVRQSGGQTMPTLMQMGALLDPPASQVRLRLTHVLTGRTGAVDVYVNGVVIGNVRYGMAPPTTLFDARPAGEDTLIVVPMGGDPDGPLVLWESRGADLFDAGETIDAFLAHEPHASIYGDVSGNYQVEFVIR